MTRIELKSRVGSDGVLTVKVPLGPQDANQDVLITVQPAPASSQANGADWKRFIDQTAGSISDPTFQRHDQGQYEKRESLL